MGGWIFEHVTEEEDANEEISSTSSSTSSSIGKNSDWCSSHASDEHCKEEEDEVQSAYNAKQGFLDSLEEALPIRKGISEFYGGRSKSFACLDEAASLTSIKEIGKVENAYNRRHRNLLAFKHVHGGGISKKSASSSSIQRKCNWLSRCESISSSNSDLSCNSTSNSDNNVKFFLHSRASCNNLLSLKKINVSTACRRRSISCPDFTLQHRPDPDLFD